MAFNKNPPPWSRNTAGNLPMNQQMIGFSQNQQVFGQNIGNYSPSTGSFSSY
jgi:hypothetical protein